MSDDKPTWRQIDTITNMVAFFTVGDKNMHSVVDTESVGRLTGVYKLPADMSKREASKAIGILMDKKQNKSAGRMYYKSNAIVDSYKAKMQEYKEKRND